MCSGEVRAVRGITSSLSAGQVIWAPSVRGTNEYVVFVGWSSNLRKFGIKNCNNRPCAIYVVKNPFHQSEADEVDLKWVHPQLVSSSCRIFLYVINIDITIKFDLGIQIHYLIL